MNQNLEILIEDHAKIMADQMNSSVKWAQSEEDIRHESNKLIDEFIKKAGLQLKGKHEYGLAGGRIDSKYGEVVLEYKYPKGPGRITEDRNSPGTKAVAEQIVKRFHDLQNEEHIGMERIFGVGCDGDTILFVRMRGQNLDVENPQPVTPHTIERLLRAIISLGARGLSFTPENLVASFGAESQTAQEGIRRFYEVIHSTQSPKAQTFFRQWQILFGEVCGYDIHGQTAKISKLAEHYMVPNSSPAELLFTIHTYYAIFIKLLAAEIVSSFSPMGTSIIKKLVAASTAQKLFEELKSLEQGGIWSQLGIRNFLEGDLFSWYIDAWDDNCTNAIREMTKALDLFDPATLSVEPAESRDLLKQLYQQLFPRSVRHDLGEYYTPDWLAELVLNELGYDGNPDKRLLDPACGSGTFLVMAINRVKIWYEEHHYECGFGDDELLNKITNNIIGFDLNPLAVMAARTNYIMAIRKLLRHADTIELPVYLCDSIMTPKDYTSVIANLTYLRLNTAVGAFNIPKEVINDRTALGRYADTIELCIRNRYSPKEFIERCEAEGIPTTEADLHKILYNHLQQLDADSKNGVWARIIKNSFAPLFIGKVDYVAGNPPWINWESLPEDYRQGMIPLWQEYGLFTLSGSAGRLGGGKKDLSMLFVYSVVDNYLEEGGRLGFVITQSIFKTQGAGDGFRQLSFKKYDRLVHLKPLTVHDLSAIQVFEGATNRTAVFICEKNLQAFSYPVSYTAWRGPSRISQEVSLTEARSLVMETVMGAHPVDPEKLSSPWLTAPKQALSGIQKVIGKSYYKAYEGVNTGGLNGVYWIRIIDKRPNGDLLIENLHDIGKIKVKQVQAVLEPDLVYPLLRGRDVQRWKAEPSAYIILAQDPQTRTGIPETVMKQKLPKTYNYLKQFEGNPKSPQRGTLRGRALFRKYYDPTDPFYSMYNVGPYTMAKWKVVWPWISVGMRVSAVGSLDSKLCVPEHNTSFCAFDSKIEANYLCSLLSSSIADIVIRSFYSGGGGGIASPDVLNSILIPRFVSTKSSHKILSELSSDCHMAMSKGDTNAVTELETEIDRIAAKLWGITDDELRTIQDALTVMTSHGK